MGQVLREYVIISACRITDPANSGGIANFTVEMFANAFSSDPPTFKQLEDSHQRMLTLREKILPARNKLAAHADRDAIRAGKPLGAASFAQWDEFWSALASFVRLINEKTTAGRSKSMPLASWGMRKCCLEHSDKAAFLRSGVLANGRHSVSLKISSIFLLVGLVLTAIGAAVTANAVIITDDRAKQLGTTMWGSNPDFVEWVCTLFK